MLKFIFNQLLLQWLTGDERLEEGRDALCDLVPSAQFFKKKHHGGVIRVVLKLGTILPATLLDGYFSQVKKVFMSVFHFLIGYYEKRLPLSQIWKNSGYTKAVVQRYSKKKGVLAILQNSQKNTCARVSLLIKLQA